MAVPRTPGYPQVLMLIPAALALALVSCEDDDATGVDRPPPDGMEIAFASDRDGDNEIYVMDADGSNPVNLTNDRASDGGPAWSPTR